MDFKTFFKKIKSKGIKPDLILDDVDNKQYEFCFYNQRFVITYNIQNNNFVISGDKKILNEILK